MSSDFVFRTAPIEAADLGRRGKWTNIFLRVREESRKGQKLVFDCTPQDVTRARANLFNRSIGKKPGEKLRTSYRDGALHLWLEFADAPNGHTQTHDEWTGQPRMKVDW